MSATLTNHPFNSARPIAPHRPLRIAFVVPGMNQGGYERCVAHLCNHLDRARFQPVIICLNTSGPAAEWLTTDDVPIVELHKKSGNSWRIIGRLADALRRHRIDLVQSHNWGTLIETVLARRRARTPLHVHAERGTVLGNLAGRGLRHWLRAKAMRWALSRVDTVVSNAQAIARRLEARCGFPMNRIQIIPNGIEPSTVSDPDFVRREIRGELQIGEEAFVIGSVGRLHHVKGFELAIRATERLIKSGCNAHLILVGDGSERERLESEAHRLGLIQCVHPVGHRHDIGRWFTAMDVYINTSLSEGMSQSLVEAMAFGLPLVATDVGDNAVVVGADEEEACGFVVPPRDVAALSRSLMKLAQDPALRERFRRQARRRHAESFTFERMINRFQTMYLELFHASPKTKRAVGMASPEMALTENPRQTLSS